MNKNNQQGQLLMEAVLAIAIIGIIASFITGLVGTSSRSNQLSGKQSVALSLAQEALVAVKSVKETNDSTSRGWNKLYELNDALDYHPDNSGSTWSIASDSEEVTVDNVVYTRKINFDNTVDRDEPNGGGDIVVSGTTDPSTIKVTITVTTSGVPDIILEEYLTRAQNETKIWDSSDTDDADTGDGFKSTGASCSNTAVIGTGTDASVELNSGGVC